MLEHYCRKSYQVFFVEPLVKRLNHCSPLTITLIAAMTGFLVLPLLWLGHTYWAVIILLFSGYLDTLDGSLARYQQTQSSRGALWDILMDRLVEIFVIFGLFSVDPINRAWPCLIMLAACFICVSSFLLASLLNSTNPSNKSFYYSPGLIERAEAFLFFIAMMLLPHYFLLLTTIFTILLLLTSFIHLYRCAHS